MRLASTLAIALTALTVPIAGTAQGPAPQQQPPPTQPGTWHHVGGVTSEDSWEETAAKRAGKRQHYYTITLQDAHVADTRASAGGSAAKVDSLTAKQGTKPYMTYKLDRVFVKSWSTSGAAEAPPTRTMGADRLTIVTTAPGGCTVGKRYPSATLTGGGKSYVLTDVTISDCSRSGPEESITFVYGKLNVEYWP